MDNLGFISRDSPVYGGKTRLQKSIGQIDFMILSVSQRVPKGSKTNIRVHKPHDLHNGLTFSPERVELLPVFFNMSKIIPALFCIFRLNLI